MKLKFSLGIEKIAEIISAEIVGSSKLDINGINNISDAESGEITFFSDDRYRKYFEETNASCVLVGKNCQFVPHPDKTYLKVDKPYLAFVAIINYIDSLKERKSSFIHPDAVIHPEANISPTAYIGPFCIVGKNSTIGDGTVLMSHVAVYDDVKIGSNNLIHSHVTICCESVIGNNCLILPGAVVGSEGFGFVENKDASYTKIPQIGNVIIGDYVEIGANTTIDRAMVGSTIIESGVKLDNLIQIAHNCKIGENTAMASQTGVSGSTIVGKRNRFGGQVGIAGHIEITDDVVLLAKSGVPSSIKEAGVYIGAPTRKKLESFRIEAAIHNLPAMVRELHELKKELAELKESKSC